MKKLGIFAGMVLLTWSCNKNNDKPDLVLEQDRMVPILTELHLAEAYINANFSYTDSTKTIYKHLEDSILKAYQTTKPVFDSSMNYYRKDLPKFDQIYAATVDSLNMRESLAAAKK